MNEKLNEALDQISDKHLEEAACYRKRRPYWIGAVAAMLALVLLAGLAHKPAPTLQGTEPSDLPTPGTPTAPGSLHLANLVASPVYPSMTLCPNHADYTDMLEYEEALFQWRKSKFSQYNQPAGYADSLTDFFDRSIPEFLAGEGNRAYSPLSLYLALAMLAETTDGSSRQQILDLLGADSIEGLRTQAGHVWNAHYSADNLTASLLANSLWLDHSYPFRGETVQTLANSHHASVFHGDLGTASMDQQLQSWLDSQTGNLLQEHSQEIELDPDTIFALASTAYFSAKWETEFSKKETAEAVFHCRDYDLTTEFMNDTFLTAQYYWGEDFGAVRLALSGNHQMWLILPDENKTVADVLESGEYLELTRSTGTWENQKTAKINLSLPKFDISSRADLGEGIRHLGVTDIFHSDISDFTPITDTPELYVGKIDHATRVAVDEEGVVAGAYTVIEILCGAAPTPGEEIDFTLNRPFLFAVTSRDRLPLFAGVVEQP